jgi:CheY-like chemotaxis protein
MQMRQERGRQILVVEPDAALRRVMALGLRQRGAAVAEAASLGDAWETIATRPEVVVLDVGLGASSEWMLFRMLRSHRLLGDVPVVLLAWECPTAATLGDERVPAMCLAKPFDARALFDAVEQLHASPALPVAMVAGVAAPAALATVAHSARVVMEVPAEHTPAPSVWPLMTAAGALLAMAGFLIHPVFVALGIVVVFAALLWWSGETFESAAQA